MIKKTLYYGVILLLFIGLQACSSSSNDSKSILNEYDLTGAYLAEITPIFMDVKPIATGKHEIVIEDLGNGEIRLTFEKFQEPPMPFMMSMDLKMRIKRSDASTLSIEGKNGIFKAESPSGSAIDPNEVPSEVVIPEGSENGMNSNEATVTGVYRIQDTKNGQFELKVIPGIPMPVHVVIKTLEKLKR